MVSKERELLVHALDRLKHINYEDDYLTNDLIQTIQKYLAQPEQEPVTDKPAETAKAVMPNGVCVTNVYDAYEEGRKSVMVKQEPDSYTTGVAAKKLFRVLGWTNKGEEK